MKKSPYFSEAQKALDLAQMLAPGADVLVSILDSSGNLSTLSTIDPRKFMIAIASEIRVGGVSIEARERDH